MKTKFREYRPAAAQNEKKNERNKNEDVKTNSLSREKFAADSRRYDVGIPTYIRIYTNERAPRRV